jgi:lipid-A-disaccharide synthase
MKTVGIVAAEPSGDQLASLLIEAIRKRQPDMQFQGIAGPAMQKAGCESWYPMEKLSVMGLVEVLKHLPELLGIRRDLVKRWRAAPPDLFIGVDAPDFNLGLQQKLHNFGIPTVQYVSPTFWAWREGRVKTLQKATDLVLSIFPFEAALLKKHGVNAVYAGHPLVQKLAELPDQNTARAVLGLQDTERVLAILPGSRMSEVRFLAEVFFKTASILKAQFADIQIIVPLATERIRGEIENCLQQFPGLKVKLVDGQSQQVLAAADLVLVASGTAALETLLHRKPMVVAYRAHWLTYFILFKLGLVRSDYIAMPNILAGREIVPEMFQDDCDAEKMAEELVDLLENGKRRLQMQEEYDEIIDQLSGGSIDQAAQAVLQLVNR